MDGLSDFVGVVIGFSVLGDDAIVSAEGGLLGCDLLNLRDFRSEALVLGNCTAVCFDDEAEEGPVVDVDVWVAFTFAREFSFVVLSFWFTAAVPGVPLRRRFFLGRRSFVLSDIEDDDAEVDREGGGPLETFWHLSIPKVRKSKGRNRHVDLRAPLEVLLIPRAGADGTGIDGPAVCWSSRKIRGLDGPLCAAGITVTNERSGIQDRVMAYWLTRSPPAPA